MKTEYPRSMPEFSRSSDSNEHAKRGVLRSKPYPFALLGYWYATLVGLVWGTLLSTGKIQRHGKLWVFTGMPRWSFARGGSCVGACYLTSHNVNEDILIHEERHRRQWRTYGMLLPLLYFLAGSNPLKNIFEIEAGLKQGGYI